MKKNYKNINSIIINSLINNDAVIYDKYCLVTNKRAELVNTYQAVM